MVAPYVSRERTRSLPAFERLYPNLLSGLEQAHDRLTTLMTTAEERSVRWPSFFYQGLAVVFKNDDKRWWPVGSALNPLSPSSSPYMTIDDGQEQVGFTPDMLKLHQLEKDDAEIYTVVPSTAFAGAELVLLPTMLHDDFGTNSHLGLVEKWRSLFLKLAIGRTDHFTTKAFVWLGHKPISGLAREVEFTMTGGGGPHQLSQALLECFYTRRVVSSGYFAQSWTEEFTHLGDKDLGVNLLVERESIGKALMKLAGLLFVADGWYQMVTRIITGGIKDREELVRRQKGLQEAIHLFVDSIEEKGLLRSEEKINLVPPGSVVVAVKAAALAQEWGGAGINMYNRNPGTVVVAPYVRQKHICGLYHNPINRKLGRFLFEKYSGSEMKVEGWDHLDESVWAENKSPQDGSQVDSDFWRTFHGTPDERDQLWIAAAQKGLTLPASALRTQTVPNFRNHFLESNFKPPWWPSNH